MASCQHCGTSTGTHWPGCPYGPPHYRHEPSPGPPQRADKKVKDEEMQIVVRICKMLRDIPSAERGEILLAGQWKVCWNQARIWLFEGEEIVIAGPIGEYADLETERWK